MRNMSLKALAWYFATIAGCGIGPVRAADLTWEVLNPFRLYQHAKSFKIHEDAYRIVRGAPDSPIPVDIVQRVERCLNDPSSGDPTTAAACMALTHGFSVEDRRRGWAARTLDDVCYNWKARPGRYPVTCLRQRNTRDAQEDYILPDYHSVSIRLDPPLTTAAGAGVCNWQWKPRSGAGKAGRATIPCNQPLVIDEVPFALDRAASGVEVSVALPDGRTLADPMVVVDDQLIVALGDSFSSGEGNPDRPVMFNARTPLDYRLPMPQNLAVVSAPFRLKRRPLPRPVILPGGGNPDPYVLPRRELSSDQSVSRPNPWSTEFNKEFWQASAQWLSADCHRSQYGYPVRVSLQLALENRHRAITLVHLGCSGAEITEGLLAPMDAREDRAKSKTVLAQLAQLTTILCRENARKSRRNPSFRLPVFAPGSDKFSMQSFDLVSCGKDGLKRPIDLVLLSIGGNDIGFSALGAYVMLNNLVDIALIAGPMDSKMRFSPAIADARLKVLDYRVQAVKEALQDGFGVNPTKVIHTSYERIQDDEIGEVCGANPTLGMDVHAKFRLDGSRMQETAIFLDRLLARLQCLTAKQDGCPANLKTGDGTGFTLVTSHQREFNQRGICARGPGDADGALMQIPRYIVDEFKPYNPASFRPYAFRTRLFRTPNDAFLTANSHRQETAIIDILQPAFAALYSGAMHPTAQAHAIVADHVMCHARQIVEKSSVLDCPKN